jgi:transcriptional regulator with XRE-family HTH domain
MTQATTTQAITFETLRDLVMHYAARRGWLTQRTVAVMCGLDESALSRLLNGEQDVGARRTHALFQAVGVPVEQYDLAYALLGRAQEQARANREARQGSERRLTPMPPAALRTTPSGWTLSHAPAVATAPGPDMLVDVPASVVVALFAERGYDGEEIAAFFAA